MNSTTTNIEILTLINGNKQPYEIQLPKIIIVGEKWNDVALAHVKENTGLDFTPISWGMQAQPTDSWQIAALFMTYNFKSRYMNNWEEKNSLLLKSDHHVGWQVDSICYNCVQHNRITTNGLQPHDRLSC